MRADAGLLQSAEGVDPPVGDVVWARGVVVLDREVAVNEDGEPGRVDVRSRADRVGVRREVERIVDPSPRREGLREHRHQAVELGLVRLRPGCIARACPVRGGRAMRDVGPQRPGLHLLQTDDVRERLERGNGSRDSFHGAARAHQTARAVPEVPNVVADDADWSHGS